LRPSDATVGPLWAHLWNKYVSSVCQTRGLWQNGRKICRDFYTRRKII